MTRIPDNRRLIGPLRDMEMEDQLAMQCYCDECEVLKEYYWLKVNNFLVAVQSLNNPSLLSGIPATPEEIEVLKNEALRALREMIAHWKDCYGLPQQDMAA